jgi:hypothetical protein
LVISRGPGTTALLDLDRGEAAYAVARRYRASRDRLGWLRPARERNIRHAAEPVPPGKSLRLEVTESGDWTFSLVDD